MAVKSDACIRTKEAFVKFATLTFPTTESDEQNFSIFIPILENGETFAASEAFLSSRLNSMNEWTNLYSMFCLLQGSR